MQLLRRLFDVAGGGAETDAFKHLAAAFTVLRSLGAAATAANQHSSRIVSLYQTTRDLRSDPSQEQYTELRLCVFRDTSSRCK